VLRVCLSRFGTTTTTTTTTKVHFITLTPWNRVLLENIIVTQLVQKFPGFYGTQKPLLCLKEATTGFYPGQLYVTECHFLLCDCVLLKMFILSLRII
jgi:hypothetical protein